MGTARKDCFGTAANIGSKAWYTVADGVLSDVYSPTIENSIDATLQYIVTDGRSFAALQQRDMTYTVSSPDPSGMVCEVTSTDACARLQAGHRLPHRPQPGQRGHADPPAAPGRASVTGLKVYARWDATIDNTGGGGAKNQGANDARIDPATTALVASDTQRPAARSRRRSRRGAGQPAVQGRVERLRRTPSDGLSQLDATTSS
jgi:hypothetical protein